MATKQSFKGYTIRLQHTDVFFIEAGPCGLTIPSLYAPYCGDYTLTDGDSEAEAITATSSTAGQGINRDTIVLLSL